MDASDRKRLYKVVGKNMDAPFRSDFTYHIGKEYRCKDINTNPAIDCAAGFYATDIDGLPYAYNIHRRVFECEVWGRRVEFDEFKRRHEYIRLVKEMSMQELVELAKPWDEKLRYRLSEVLNPINPINITPPDITEAHIELVRQWDSVRASVGASVWDSMMASVRASVRDSVWDSVRASVWDSVRASVGASVWDSVGDSVSASVSASMSASVRASMMTPVGYSVRDSMMASMRDSVSAYVGSLFTCVYKWKYIDHIPGVYPFQPAVDLWKQGLVPSYDGKVWRLHGGKKMGVLWVGTFN